MVIFSSVMCHYVLKFNTSSCIFISVVVEHMKANLIFLLGPHLVLVTREIEARFLDFNLVVIKIEY